MKNKTSSTTGVLSKAIEILDLMSGLENPAGISEIAAETGVNISTAYRIASELVEHGYLRQDENRGKYTLGWKFLKSADTLLNKLEVRKVALPFLQKLRLSSGESTNLAVLDNHEVIYVEHIESNHTLRTFTAVGNRAPVYCTGVGKIFWANMEKARSDALINIPRKQITKNTLTDERMLLKELDSIKREGVALDNGEMEVGVRCIAAPVLDAGGSVAAAVSISGPDARLTVKKINELKQMVKKSALDISRALGYDA